MNRIDTTFSTLAKDNNKALVAFLTAGDPDIARSQAIVSAMCRAGVDILELGIAFSDPTADGPVIQRSSMRAIGAGITIDAVLDMVRTLRGDSAVPVILFSYYNPIYHYGPERFVQQAKSAGADGVLIVDLPFESSDEFTQFCDDDFVLISLVSPNTEDTRLVNIAAQARGFIYQINRLGITGTGGVDTAAIAANAHRIKAHTDVPVCMGFGISGPADAAAVAPFADGVVIGSLFERYIEEHAGDPTLAEDLAGQVRAIKTAMDAAVATG